MKTAKNLQILDNINNNISPATGIESLYYENIVASNGNVRQYRYPLYNKILLNLESSIPILNSNDLPDIFQKKYLSFVYDISIYNQEAGDVSVKVLEINKYKLQNEGAHLVDNIEVSNFVSSNNTLMENEILNISNNINDLSTKVNSSFLYNNGTTASLSTDNFNNGFLFFGDTANGNKVTSFKMSDLSTYLNKSTVDLTSYVKTDYLTNNYYNKDFIDSSYKNLIELIGDQTEINNKLNNKLNYAATDITSNSIDNNMKLYVYTNSMSTNFVKITDLANSGILNGLSTNIFTDTNKYYLTGSNNSQNTTNEKVLYKNSNIYMTTSGLYHASDEIFKTDIKDIDREFVDKLFDTYNGLIHKFVYKENNKDSVGFIAQELLDYIPEAVEKNKTYSVNYDVALSKIVGALFKKVKEQEIEIENLKKLILKK